MGLFGKKMRFASEQDLATAAMWEKTVAVADKTVSVLRQVMAQKGATEEGNAHVAKVMGLRQQLQFRAADVQRDLPGMEARMRDGQQLFDNLMAAMTAADNYREQLLTGVPQRPQAIGRPERTVVKPDDFVL